MLGHQTIPEGQRHALNVLKRLKLPPRSVDFAYMNFQREAMENKRGLPRDYVKDNP